jgi:hypothetical protein
LGAGSHHAAGGWLVRSTDPAQRNRDRSYRCGDSERDTFVGQQRTGATRDTTADGDGRYSFLQVTPGNYKLTAKAAGFSDVVVNNLELQVNSPAPWPISFEKLGATSTTVSVEATTVQVNTVDATLGNAISNQAIQQLPFFRA